MLFYVRLNNKEYNCSVTVLNCNYVDCAVTAMSVELHLIQPLSLKKLLSTVKMMSSAVTCKCTQFTICCQFFSFTVATWLLESLALNTVIVM